METLTAALSALVAADPDLRRTPQDLGLHIATESEPHAGTVHGPRYEVLLDPLLIALPLPRLLVLSAASTGLIDLRLPADAPKAAAELLAEAPSLSADQAATIVDRTVDVLAHHLAVRPDQHAGLAEGGHALAQLDLVIADAVADGRPGVAEVAAVLLAVLPEVGDVDELAQWIGGLGLTETAAHLAATAV